MGCCTELKNNFQTVRNTMLRRSEDGKSDQSHQGAAAIPLCRKICYALGGIPYQMTTIAIGISLQIFLLDVVQISAAYVSMILFVSRAWDAVTDPVIGFLVSRSKQTRIGKLIPWMVVSAPLGVMSYLLQWYQPPGLVSVPHKVLWFLFTTCLFETLISCYNVPYLSLNMFLGGDQRDRDSATAYRMCAEMVSMLLASIIQGQVVAVYSTEKEETCEELQQVHGSPQSTTTPQVASLQETQGMVLTCSLVLGSLFFLSSLVLFFGVKEQNTVVPSGDTERPSYLTSLKMIFCHVPYQRLILGFVLADLAFQMSWSNFALFCSHAAGLGAQFHYLLLALLISASVSIPAWQAVLLRIGKRKTTLIGISLYIPAVLIITCVPTSLPLFLVTSVVMGLSVATAFLLPWSMLPDVVDDFAEKHPSFTGLEPLFFSGYAFSSKLAGGLSAGFSTMMLQFVGYRAAACSHDDRVVTTLIVLFSGVPVAFMLVAMVFFYFYPIDEKQLREQPTTINPTEDPIEDPTEDTEQSAFMQQLDLGVRSSPQNTRKTSFMLRLDSSLGRNTSGKRPSVKSTSAEVCLKTPGCCPVERASSHRNFRLHRPHRIPTSDAPGSGRTDMRSAGLWV